MTRTLNQVRDSLLVALTVKRTGGIHYRHLDRTTERDDGTRKVESWQTVKITEDPAEAEAADVVRYTVRNKVAGVCSQTPFGLMIPADRAPELFAVLSEMQALVDNHNAQAKSTYVEMHCLQASVAGSDENAARAILGEAASLVQAMEQSIASADVKKIRKAASRARILASLLDDKAEETLTSAVRAARAAARKIAQDIGAATEATAEALAEALADVDLSPVETGGAFLLNLADAGVAPSEALPTVDVQAAARLDLPEPASEAPVVDETPIGRRQPAPSILDDLLEPEDTDETEPALFVPAVEV